MKRTILTLVAILALSACSSGRQFIEKRPGLYNGKSLTCLVNIDTGTDHHDYSYGTVECFDPITTVPG